MYHLYLILRLEKATPVRDKIQKIDQCLLYSLIQYILCMSYHYQNSQGKNRKGCLMIVSLIRQLITTNYPYNTSKLP